MTTTQTVEGRQAPQSDELRTDRFTRVQPFEVYVKLRPLTNTAYEPHAAFDVWLGNRRLLIGDLGWTVEQAQITRTRLASFEEDWDAPGMESYDAL